MKTKGMIVAALLLSGAAFAQAPVKAGGSVKAGQAIEAGKAGLKAGTEASGSARIHGMKAMKAKVEDGIQTAADHAYAAKQKVGQTAADVVNNAPKAVQVNANTNANVQADQAAVKVRTKTGISSGVKAPAVKDVLHHSGVMHTKVVPVKVSTRINGGAGLRIL